MAGRKKNTSSEQPVSSPASWAFGAAKDLLIALRELGHWASEHDFESRRSDPWQDLGTPFAHAFMAVRDLNRFLTDEVRDQVRNSYPPGSLDVRFATFPPKHTLIEALADQAPLLIQSPSNKVQVALEKVALVQDRKRCWKDAETVWTTQEPGTLLRHWIKCLKSLSSLDYEGLLVQLDREARASLSVREDHERSADTGDFRPARWFPKGMAPRLRKAAGPGRGSMRVATRIIDGVVCYSVADACRWWPADMPKEAQG